MSGNVSSPEGKVRLVLEAECSSCGPIFQRENAGLRGIDAALQHTSATGHIVILNGTIDLPELDLPEPVAEDEVVLSPGRDEMKFVECGNEP
jgi:hypothetical protein